MTSIKYHKRRSYKSALVERPRIPIAAPSINDEDVAAVSSAVSSGWISGRGKYVNDFELRFGHWLGSSNVVACSSGTSALHLGLLAAGVKRDDEVIIPTFSMGAIPFSVSYLGAKQVLVDSERETWNMDVSQISDRITSKTKAIVAMHTYGHPVNLAPLVKLCQEHGIKLIEDAAEAHGAEFEGKKVGTIGDIGCFSFFANKIITTGEGGAVITRSDADAEKCRSLRDMSFSKDPSQKFLHASIGFNYRLTNMQAALGYSQLGRIDKFISTRRRNAKLYDSMLGNIRGITTPQEAKWAKNVYWMYSILVDAKNFGKSRDALMIELSRAGIETRPFFVPIHRQPVYSSYHVKESYPIADKLSGEGLNLPSGNTLTEDEVRYVADTLISLSGKS